MADLGKGLSGAGSGAATGAALGSVVPGVGTVIGGAIGAIGGLLGGLFSSGDRDRAEAAYQAALEEIQRIGAPPDLAREILMDKFKVVGVYTPQLEQAVDQISSQVAGYEEAPEMRKAQTGALESLRQLSESGMRPEDTAAYARAQTEASNLAEAKRQQILQNLQSRGVAGGGAEIAMAQQAAQAGANRLAQSGLDIAGQASQRALQALGGYGDLAGRIRGTDTELGLTKARASDELSRFNIQNAVNRQMRNVGAMNLAQQQNLTREQEITNLNAQLANQERLRKATASRQQWLDQMSRAQALAGGKMGEAGFYEKKAGDTAQSWQNIGSGLGTVATGIYGANEADKLRQQQQTEALRKEQMETTRLQQQRTFDSQQREADRQAMLRMYGK